MSVSQAAQKEVDSYLAPACQSGDADNHSIPSRTVLTHLTFLPPISREATAYRCQILPPAFPCFALSCLPSLVTSFSISAFLFSSLPTSLHTRAQKTETKKWPLPKYWLRWFDRLLSGPTKIFKHELAYNFSCKRFPKSSSPLAS